MCKFLTILLILSSILNARVITIVKTFDKVYVTDKAKSKQVKCITKIDLDESLIDNRLGCDIKKIDVRNKNGMWIGQMAEDVEHGIELRYSDYDRGRYKGKGVQVEITYFEPTVCANNVNDYLASCPAGMSLYDYDCYYHCKKHIAVLKACTR